MSDRCICAWHMGMRDPDPDCPHDHRSLDEQITELASAYQWAIRGEHHKDRDCHWAIVKEWSYGDAPIYHVDHEGYLHEWYGSANFATSEAAHRALATFLAKALEDIKTWDEGDDPA